MSRGSCVRLILLSLTFCQHANVLSYRSGGSYGVQPFFDYSGSSSHSRGGKVDSNSPEGSVSSYRPRSLNIQQNSQKPLQTNPDGNGVLQTKAGMWDLLLPQNGKRFESGIASSRGIVIQSAAPSRVDQPAAPSRVYQPPPRPVQGLPARRPPVQGLTSPPPRPGFDCLKLSQLHHLIPDLPPLASDQPPELRFRAKRLQVSPLSSSGNSLAHGRSATAAEGHQSLSDSAF
ncbi:uncharacterized protein LOC129097719 [Anoplopoma fimbria]|uniref:uncharacterized protein LOC129097719 n=1 Tax=Anoplopoma fimbria TaxID=229290 RepID=UPI0023ED7A47|nr:uncharacterized protein LOC129097719 [Anoplopoma fimbria]